MLWGQCPRCWMYSTTGRERGQESPMRKKRLLGLVLALVLLLGAMLPTLTSAQEPPRWLVQVASASVNIRAGPSLVSPIIAVAAQGQQFWFTSYDATGAWVLVQAGNGQMGWVYRGLVQIAPLSQDAAPVDGLALASPLATPTPTPRPKTATTRRRGVSPFVTTNQNRPSGFGQPAPFGPWIPGQPAPTGIPVVPSQATPRPGEPRPPSSGGSIDGVPNATPTPDPDAVFGIERTPTPTPAPIPTAGGGGVVIEGKNKVCTRPNDELELCAWVSDDKPAQNSTVTVTGVLLSYQRPRQGRTMIATWNYKTTTVTCTGTTNTAGAATCERQISQATSDFQVNVDVTIDGITATTFFTPP